MFTGATVEALTNGFPNPPAPVSKIRGKPNRKTLDEVIELITGNATSITTLLGGGQHGYTAICMSAARYNSLVNTVPLIRSLTLGEYVHDISVKTTAAQQEEKFNEYNLREHQFHMY